MTALSISDLRAQSNGNNSVTDAAAISVLQSSLSAMGGTSAWNSIQDWVITGSVSSNASAQTNATFTWKGAGNEFRFEIDGNQTTNIFVSGHGAPARVVNGTSTPINYHVARANAAYHLPGFRLLQELNNSQLNIRYIGAATVQGRPAIQVHVSDDSDSIGSLVTPHDWYFEPVSFLPLRVTVRLPTNENAGDYLNGAFDFAQFQSVSGVLVPFQVSLSKDYAPQKVFAVSSTIFNSGVPSSAFDTPNGGGQ